MPSKSLEALRLHAQTGMFVRGLEKNIDAAEAKKSAPATKPHEKVYLASEIKYLEETKKKLEKLMTQKGGKRSTRRRKNRKSKQSRRR